VLENLHRFLLFDLTTSLGFDIPRAVTTAVLVLVLGAPVLAALRRVCRRAAFDALVEFESLGEGIGGDAPVDGSEVPLGA
jgi:energy-coupling factor transport system substrate-specific component